MNQLLFGQMQYDEQKYLPCIVADQMELYTLGMYLSFVSIDLYILNEMYDYKGEFYNFYLSYLSSIPNM